MRRLLFLLLGFLLVAGCSEIQTTKCPDAQTVTITHTQVRTVEVPAPGKSHCPFGTPVFRCRMDCTAPITVIRQQYTLAYWPDTMTPLWVCETLTSKELEGTAKRKRGFSYDPLVPKLYQVSSSTYTNSGFDRAHLASATNQLWNQDTMNETFFMSNVVPMKPGFNRGIWSQLEKWVRQWVVKNGDAYVITGPIFGSDPKNLLIAMDHVTVPTHYFKILIAKRGTTTYHALALIVTHSSDHEAPFKWKFYQTNVDWVELATDLNLMPGLSASKEKVLEEKTENFDLWD